MNKELFESLLYEEESTTLDFKKEQYRFAKASDEDKSELVKDILGFANAWRRAKAYILIGVKDVRGGRSTVLGIPQNDHLDDHSLQQFVNNLTNAPVRFHYRAFAFEEKQVGIITIDEGQARPLYLRRQYGKLEREKVFVRRGSSTDPSQPASLEEIAQMGATGRKDVAELLVEFSEVDTEERIGPRLPLKCEFCDVPEEKDIPKLTTPDVYAFTGTGHSFNQDYYRELAGYEFMTRLHQPTRLAVRNIGEVMAGNVRVEITFQTLPLHALLHLPIKPLRETWYNGPDLRSIHSRWPGSVDIHQNKQRTRIVIDCKDLQPGRQVWSDRFYLGTGSSGDYTLQGTIYADNLPTPQTFSLTVAADVTQSSLTVEQLCGKR